MAGTSELKSDAAPLLSIDVWRRFCARLGDAGEAILRAEAPATPLDRAEGFRFLTRLMRIGLIQNLEASDPDFPFFYRPCDEITKYGGDNPDNVYWSAMVRGDREYRISATRGTIFYFSIGSKAFRFEQDGSIVSTGELTGANLTIGSDGRFEIIVSSKKHSGNWLPMQLDSNFLLIRQTYFDKAQETPGSFKIECLSRPPVPRPLDPAALEQALQRTAEFVVGTAKRFGGDWTLPFAKDRNSIIARDQGVFFRAGGDPLITYLYGCFDLQPNEGLIFEVTPPHSIFWNCSLYNWWNESFDYEHRQVTFNNHTAKRNADGSVTFLVAARDCGVGNWLDTAGHQEGLVLIRWYAADANPQPSYRVVQLDELTASTAQRSTKG